MPEEPKFEHTALEADMKQLAQEIQKHRESPELKGVGEKELLKQAIKTLPPQVGTPPPPPPPASSGPLPQYASDLPPEIKLEIEYLLDEAFHKGIAAAEAEARKSSAFILDAFHDALAGKLYPELQKRGILK